MARLGYPPQRLHELCPRLVIASITAYGATGPLASRTGHDINCLGFAGLLERLGDERTGPLLPPVPLADLVGGLLPALMVTAYVRRAEQTGQGAVIDTSLAEAIALLPTSADVPGRGSFRLGQGLASFGVYPCRDGYVAVGSQEHQFWQALCDLVEGLEEFRERQADAKAQDGIRACLQRFFASRTRCEITGVFAERDACVSPVLSYEEMLASEHAQARQFVVSDERIPLPVLAFPAMVDGRRLPERGPAPAQGQDTDAILAELLAGKARADTSTPHGAVATAGSTEDAG
jgi:crotonobetainyl-CoA:carnitine CoA-transferase CaiB-like acyl-CoA transferase